ncbi:PASTA domain-containing protein [Bacteroidia bacterium]|nr:PASTA domain-containing protein [Bacteroidia bacterium]GHU78075.1 PASTA domain-containing protein [Bacteroidia bacterium]
MSITDKLKNPFVSTLLLAIVISGVLIYGTLKWLDSYTLHNKAVVVPDVKGLPLEEAAGFLVDRGLRYNVIDSVFSKNVRPGTIVEVSPSIGSKVKSGRIVFITVNALTSQMAAVPSVRDMSFRQAYSLLKASGFESIEVEYVSGAYKDLAVSIDLHGRELEEGEKVLLSAPLVLKISNGTRDLSQDEGIDTDSIESEVETWFE